MGYEYEFYEGELEFENIEVILLALCNGDITKKEEVLNTELTFALRFFYFKKLGKYNELILQKEQLEKRVEESRKHEQN